MKTFKLTLILVVFGAAGAAAQNMDIGRNALWNGLFDGRSAERLEMPHFSPGFAAPVIENLSPGFVFPAVETASDILRVMAEVAVADTIGAGSKTWRLRGVLNALRRKHGFVPDATFAVVRQKEKPFSILPFPPAPKKPVFIVRGFIRNGALQGLKADPAVLKAWLDAEKTPAPGSQESLLKFIQKHGDEILTVASVAAVELGLDCGLDGRHYHIIPHKPAVIITLDGTVARDRVLAALSAAVPQLQGVSYLVTTPEVSAL